MEILVEGPIVSIIPADDCPVALLRKKGGTEELTVTLNVFSLQNMVMAIENIRSNRPTIHQLYVNSLETLGATVEKVVINDMVDGIYHFCIFIITQEGQTELIDAHVTDALIIATIKTCPIFVTEEVFKKLDREKMGTQNKILAIKAAKMLENFDSDRLIRH